MNIKNFENLYAITKSGNVYSYINKIFLKPGINNDGYATVNLYKDKTSNSMKIHRLVAEHYLLNDNCELEINHKDGNKLNNNVDNLEWCTRSQNVKHAYDNNLAIPRNQQKVAVYKDSTFIEEFISMKECARKLAIPFNSVRMVVIGKYKQTHGFIIKRL